VRPHVNVRWSRCPTILPCPAWQAAAQLGDDAGYGQAGSCQRPRKESARSSSTRRARRRELARALHWRRSSSRRQTSCSKRRSSVEANTAAEGIVRCQASGWARRAGPSERRMRLQGRRTSTPRLLRLRSRDPRTSEVAPSPSAPSRERGADMHTQGVQFGLRPAHEVAAAPRLVRSSAPGSLAPSSHGGHIHRAEEEAGRNTADERQSSCPGTGESRREEHSREVALRSPRTSRPHGNSSSSSMCRSRDLLAQLLRRRRALRRRSPRCARRQRPGR